MSAKIRGAGFARRWKDGRVGAAGRRLLAPSNRSLTSSWVAFPRRPRYDKLRDCHLFLIHLIFGMFNHVADGLLKFLYGLFKSLYYQLLAFRKFFVVWFVVKQTIPFVTGNICSEYCVMPEGLNNFPMQGAVISSSAQTKRLLDVIRYANGCSFHNIIVTPKWYQCNTARLA